MDKRTDAELQKTFNGKVLDKWRSYGTGRVKSKPAPSPKKAAQGE